LFPHLAGVVIEKVERPSQAVEIWGRVTAQTACCQSCGTVASRVHSRYRRHLGDVSVAGQPVVIHLTVRRFLCPAADYARRTFAEQGPGLTWRYGRRTPVARQMLEAIGLALGGRAGARLAAAAGVAAGRATVLRLVRALPEPVLAAPVVLGIDDFALRRGKSYGTVLADMVTRRPVDLLAGRHAQVIEDWLAAHPGVQVICRDRASAYAEGARAGAPDAVQVADRWHVWQNLTEAAEKCVIQHQACLREPAGPDELPIQAPEPEAPTALVTRIRERYAAVQELTASGTGYRPVARQLGLGLNTVKRYARAASVEELLESAARPSNLDDFKPYLHQRVSQGQASPARLFEEIHARGYTGSKANLRDYLRRYTSWARASSATPPPPSARDTVTWLTQHPDGLDEQTRPQLAAILGRCPELDALHGAIRGFAVMVTRRRGERLPQWLAQARAIGLPGLNSFVTGIEHDLAAVTAGLTQPWNSGLMEGHVNRIKMLKRQMYGRANLDLLRKRVLMSP
jgi:transposase